MTAAKQPKYRAEVRRSSGNVEYTLTAASKRGIEAAIRSALSWAAQSRGRVTLQGEGRGEYAILLPDVTAWSATVKVWDGERQKYVGIR